MSLLVTAFGDFDGGPNCSEALLARLAAERPSLEALWGAPIRLAMLPICTETVRAELVRLVAECRPSHVLLTGQAGGRTHLSLERVARNHRDLAVPDVMGRLGAFGPVSPGGAAELRASWPDLEAAAQALREDGYAAAVSDDAGSHLCNQTLYLALELAEWADPPFVATFLHLPLLPEQVSAAIPAALRHEGCPAMPLDDMTRAVRLFLVHTRRPASRL